ncbi:alpha/beta fold hydrolase [Sphingomonas gei]|uniref:Alpha/beta fold hydrolase n=1 Tax=Sphingomonas gei TaxID=1395960 RepID=A0A4S1XL41_9SPHN|nr:alpha/beta fold hydrolase [Sphingomonas gei]TGX55926.1 alpha/beta fold hydrolase [Sphingomonas gei]
MIELYREGRGTPLLLVHGLGGSRRSWDPIRAALAAEREVLSFDLPGHGETPAEADSGTFLGLMRSLETVLDDHRLGAIDMVGTSMGARMVLEAARRGHAGATVALDPGGFWKGWERRFFSTTLRASLGLLQMLRPALPALAHNAAGRTALLAQLSARPWALDGDLVARELQGLVATRTFAALVRDLAEGPMQQGSAAERITIGWGRHDRLCLPRQAARAMAAFPNASLHWFERSGHFPMWDEPAESASLILAATG